MKRKALLFLLVVCFLFFGLLSCDNQSMITTKKENKENEKTETTDETIRSEKLYFVQLREDLYANVSLTNEDSFDELAVDYVKNSIVTHLMEMTDVSFAFTQSNTPLAEQADWSKEVCLELDGVVVGKEDDFISLMFRGLFNRKGTAHPSHIFFTLNFDPNMKKEVDLQQYYTVEDDFYEIFSQKALADLVAEAADQNPQRWQMFLDEYCGKEVFLSALRLGNGTQEIYYYFTEDAIGFSFSVPYAMGGNRIVELELSAIQGRFGD